MDKEKHHILIADDAGLQRKILAIHLGQRGYEVTCAANGLEAFEKARQVKPDLIVSDVLMPEMDGFALTRCLRADEQLARVPIVLVSAAQVNEADLHLAKTMGACAFLHRTPDCSTILSTLERHFSGLQPLNIEHVGAPCDPTYRALFLAEGQRDCRQLAAELEKARLSPDRFDFTNAAALAHRWAGTAGGVGCAEIGAEALRLDALLNRSAIPNIEPIAASIDQLLALFIAADAEDVAPLLSEPMRQTLAGKRFALIGFDAAEADQVSRFFAAIPAFASVLPPDSALPNHPVLRAFHAVILKLGGDPVVEWWLDPYVAAQAIRPVLQTRESPPIEIALRIYALLLNPPPRPVIRSEADPRKLRLLIADDDPAITELLRAACSLARLECFSATDGVTALTLARQVRPDITLLDVNMPHLDGFQVLSYLKRDSDTRSLKTVLCSARQLESDVLRAFSLGADAYITKPFNPFALVQRLRQLALQAPSPAAA